MWRQVHPYHDYIWNVHLTQIHGLWGHHQGYFALSSSYNINRAWLCTWLLGMCTGETNITLPRHVWTCSFKPLLKRSESIYHYIIFLFEIMIGRLTTKLKTLYPSHHRKQNSYSSFCLLQQTWCLVMSYPVWGTIHTNIGCQGDSSATLDKLMSPLCSYKRRVTCRSRARCYESRGYRSSLIIEIWREQ